MIHNNKPMIWAPATAKTWCKLVDDTPDLEWHHTVNMNQLMTQCNEA